MRSTFPGFPEAGMQFLRELKENNRREWFQPRKQIYEENVRGPMLELVNAVNAEMMSFAPAYVGEPAEAVYRIYRDTRFSNDKTPYKTFIAAVFPKRGIQKHAGAGLYFSVSPAEIEIAGGVYMPPQENVRAIRLYLRDHHEEFRKLAAARGLVKAMGEMKGERLSRVPKGFPAEHPATDLVRQKQWVWWTLLGGELATTKKLQGEVVKRFRAMAEMMDFLNVPLQKRKAGARTFLR